MRKLFALIVPFGNLTPGAIGTLEAGESLVVFGGCNTINQLMIYSYAVEISDEKIQNGDTIIVVASHTALYGKIRENVVVDGNTVELDNALYHIQNVRKVKCKTELREFLILKDFGSYKRGQIVNNLTDNRDPNLSLELLNRREFRVGDSIVHVGPQDSDGAFQQGTLNSYTISHDNPLRINNVLNWDFEMHKHAYRIVKTTDLKDIKDDRFQSQSHKIPWEVTIPKGFSIDKDAVYFYIEKETKMKEMKVTEVELCEISRVALERHASDFARVLKFSEVDYNGDGVIYFYQTDDFSQGDGWTSAKVKNRLQDLILENKDTSVLDFCVSHCLIRNIRFAKTGHTVSEMLNG